MISPYSYSVDAADGMVVLSFATPPLWLVVARFAMSAEKAIELGSELIEKAQQADPVEIPTPKYRVQVRRGRDDHFWTFSCPAHAEVGIGLFHDQSSALTAANAHLADRH